MSLPFEPACLPLLLGGLPHRSAAQALEVSRHHAAALLTWPQLPQRSFREQSLVQSLIGFPGAVIDAIHARAYVDRGAAERGLDQLGLAYLENNCDYAALAEDDAAGLDEVLRQSYTTPMPWALKGQLMGPISLATHITDEQQRPLIYDNIMFDALAQHLRLRAAWLEARLRERIDTTIICLDEPFLETVGLPFLPVDWEAARDQLDIVLGGIAGCKGIFAGGAVDWAEVLLSSVELIIVDAYDHGQSLVAAAAALPAFLDRDGIVGLGLVPADADALGRSTAEGLLQHTIALFDELARAGVSIDWLVRQAVISTSGTVSRLDVATAERALQLVAGLSQLLRAHYQLDQQI
jgi:hypothetical protein